MWYVAYRHDGATRMRVFKTRRRALRTACEMLGKNPRSDVEVGPMLKTGEDVLNAAELRRICGASEEASAPAAEPAKR